MGKCSGEKSFIKLLQYRAKNYHISSVAEILTFPQGVLLLLIMYEEEK
jgi:hypothetical protein